MSDLFHFIFSDFTACVWRVLCTVFFLNSCWSRLMGVKKIIYWKIILDSRNYALTITFSRLEVSSADSLFTLLKEAYTYI